jgi:hypothetical protein
MRRSSTAAVDSAGICENGGDGAVNRSVFANVQLERFEWKILFAGERVKLRALFC